MSGEIGVSSVKGGGATFWFTIPLKRSSNQSAIAVNFNLPDLRVLIVDDNEITNEVLNKYLKSWGLRYGTANSAGQALEMLRESVQSDPYGLVIADLSMPDRTGLQLAKLITDDKIFADLKLIMITAFGQPAARENTSFAGFDGYVTKPIQQSQLFDCIATAFQFTERKVLSAEIATRPVVEYPRRTESVLIVDGFSSDLAMNGLVALEMMDKKDYAIVFMDCQMPVLDGFEATRVRREAEIISGKRVVIVAMTALAVEGSRERCLAAGMDDYITKPIDTDKLLGIVEKWLPV